MRRRRRIGALAAAGMADFAIISLYQMGNIRSLPDLPGRVFDSNGVNASEKAYASGVPDGTTGAALYAANLMLASAGGSRRSGRKPILDLLLAGSVAAGVVGAAQYLYNMARKQEKACLYCITGAALNAAMVPPAYAEARDAVRELRRR